MKNIFRTLIACAFLLSFLVANTVLAKTLSDSKIKKILIEESISYTPGNCPCPYHADSAGRRCGGRSSYSRGGGYSPLCYNHDISKEMIQEYRQQLALEEQLRASKNYETTEPQDTEEPNLNTRQAAYQPKPKYPTEARRNRLQGRNQFQLSIDSTGSVTSIKMIKSSGHQILDIAAVEALKSWKYAPGSESLVKQSFKWTLLPQ